MNQRTKNSSTLNIHQAPLIALPQNSILLKTYTKTQLYTRLNFKIILFHSLKLINRKSVNATYSILNNQTQIYKSQRNIKAIITPELHPQTASSDECGGCGIKNRFSTTQESPDLGRVSPLTSNFYILRDLFTLRNRGFNFEIKGIQGSIRNFHIIYP